MTTLAIGGIKAVASNGLSGLVRFGTQLAITTARSAIEHALDNRVFEGPRLESFHLQTSRDGAPMPRVFGRARLAGQVIWSSAVRENVTEEEVGGKGGGPVQRSYSYSVSFAVGLCEGPILGVDRIWANGEILPRSDLTIRIHTGSEDQGPDPVIAATEGGAVPAFRGTAYIVFEDFPLETYGNRLPLINAEVVRAVRRDEGLEALVQSVNLLPGSGEFALSPTVVEETPTAGEAVASNMNGFSGDADMVASLDQLQAELPRVGHVNLISAWFGTSMDAATCEVHPGAECLDRRLPDRKWRVAGVERRDAYIVSQDADGRANYGGTPSDDTVIACIHELRRRGLDVTLYPFLLMDAPGFPWCGRISASDAAAVDAFFGTDNDFRFRHSILHHARLAVEAGGVEAIVIGSELKDLMAGANHHAVEKMRELAADVRAIVGPGCKITYAADWSDYFGVQRGGDVTYHLDPLWADVNIDVVGIDAYVPLADWRDVDGHLDAEPGRTGHDLDYLRANVEGGEGFDWYYANQHDRDRQVRTPITDPVYAYKNLRHWWSTAHVNRVDGQPAGQTAWTPRGKPIWLLEVGCPAVDKGANQPNVFIDAKSVESRKPYYSSGARDDLIQRRYLEALLGHYADTNEFGFIDLSRTSVWAWDLRPYPYFPARTDVWSDGENWTRGHWLNGRTGLMPVADIITELVGDTGLADVDVSGVGGVIPGYVVDRPMSARAALEPLMRLFDIEVNERGGRVSFSIGGGAPLALPEPLAEGPVTRTRADAETRVRDVRVTYIDAGRDYQQGSASARNLDAQSVAVVDIAAPAVLDEGFARHVAKRELDAAHAGGEGLSVSLPLSTGLSIEPGDRLSHDGRLWAVVSVEAGAQVDIRARRDVGVGAGAWVRGATPEDPGPVPFAAAPQLLAFDLPGRSGISVGALLSPFTPVTVEAGGSAATLEAPLRLGATLTPLPARTPALLDRATQLDVRIPGLRLSAQQSPTLHFAVEMPQGWEIIAAQGTELVDTDTYRLSCLLRGLEGSDAFMADIPPGARVLWLGYGVQTLALDDDWRGSEVRVAGRSEARDAREGSVVWQDAAGLPLPPAHLAYRDGTLSWVGRALEHTEWGASDAQQRFRVRLFRGADVEVVDVTGPSLATPPFDRAEVSGLSALGRESAYPASLLIAGA